MLLDPPFSRQLWNCHIFHQHISYLSYLPFLTGPSQVLALTASPRIATFWQAFLAPTCLDSHTSRSFKHCLSLVTVPSTNTPKKSFHGSFLNYLTSLNSYQSIYRDKIIFQYLPSIMCKMCSNQVKNSLGSFYLFPLTMLCPCMFCPHQSQLLSCFKTCFAFPFLHEAIIIC